jgi:hypothetical protein
MAPVAEQTRCLVEPAFRWDVPPLSDVLSPNTLRCASSVVVGRLLEIFVATIARRFLMGIDDGTPDRQVNRPDKTNNPNGQRERTRTTGEVGDEGGGTGDLEIDRRSHTTGSEATSTVAASDVEVEDVQRPRKGPRGEPDA